MENELIWFCFLQNICQETCVFANGFLCVPRPILDLFEPCQNMLHPIIQYDLSQSSSLVYAYLDIPAVVENTVCVGLLTVMTGSSHVACIITIAVKGGPGLRAFSSMFTVVG